MRSGCGKMALCPPKMCKSMDIQNTRHNEQILFLRSSTFLKASYLKVGGGSMTYCVL